MITAIAASTPLDLQDAEEMARRLHRLLTTLHQTSQASTIIYYRPAPRSPGLLHMLEQFQDINRQSKDEATIALSEFSTGLYYLSWQQFTDADAYLRKAALYWSLINAEAAGCLAHFALGCTQFLALNYVMAMKHVSRARRSLDKLQRSSTREIDPSAPRAFLEQMHEEMTDVQHQLQTAMEALWTGPTSDHQAGPAPAAGQPPAAGHPPGSYATGIHVDADFPAEPVIDPRLQPRAHFVAPFPSHVPAGDHYQWMQVTQSSGTFVANVQVGDWLYIDTAPSHQQFHLDDLLIIGSQINGSVRVEARGQRPRRPSGSPLYVAKFVRNTSTGQIILLPNEQRQLVTLDAAAIIGSVVGFWREMQLQHV